MQGFKEALPVARKYLSCPEEGLMTSVFLSLDMASSLGIQGSAPGGSRGGICFEIHQLDGQKK